MMQREAPPMPPNWEARFDPSQRRYFFINHVTKKTQWEDPRFQTQPRPAVSAARSLSPSRDVSSSHYSQAYQMQEISAMTEQISQSLEESSLSEEVDQAIVSKLVREFPKAGKDLITDMLVSCHNNERETRDQMKDIFGKSSTSGNGASSHQTSSNSHEPEAQQLSNAEKDRVITQMSPLYPELPESVIRMAMDMVKYDTTKGKFLLQKLWEEEKEKEANERNRKEGKGPSSSSSSGPAPTAPVSLLPTTFNDSSSNRPQGLSSCAAPGTSNANTHQPQPINKARQVTKIKIRAPAAQKKSTITQQPHQSQPPPLVSSLSQKSAALGPDPSLCKGPDPSLLSSDMSVASGPDLTLQHGPDRSLRSGPNRTHVCGPMGAKGPDSSFRCGPQFSGLTSPTRVLVSDI